MSLIYLVTSLPKLSLGQRPPFGRAELVRRSRHALEGPERAELERLLLIEEVDESARIVGQARADDPNISATALLGKLRSDRRLDDIHRSALELVDDAPWLLEIAAPHQYARRWYQHLYSTAKSRFLRSWAETSLDLEETLTGLLAQREAMSRTDFLLQMEGRFDSSSKVIIENYESAGLGVDKRFPFFEPLKAAVEGTDLVEMERQIDRLRWKIVDDAMGVEVFSLDTLLATYLHLRILEREASWDQDAGTALLDQLIATPEELAPWQGQAKH